MGNHNQFQASTLGLKPSISGVNWMPQGVRFLVHRMETRFIACPESHGPAVSIANAFQKGQLKD
jgi:hypothetical protein